MPVATNITYNQNGQMTHLERNNDAITDYTYDPNQAFRLTRILTTSGQDTLQDLNYTYDPVGNILNLIDNANTDLKKSATYTYDDLNRLLSATVSYTNHPDKNYTQTFTYDSIGNMTYNSDLGTMNYANGQPHQLSSYGTRNFVYDTAGNMTRNGGITKFTWDWRNRLTNTFDIASENNTYYKYDHNNQRFIKWTEDYLYYPPDPEEPIEDLANRDLPRELSVSEDSLSEETLNLDGTGGYWAWTVVAMDRYVDKYFEKNLNNQTKSHIYLNDIKIATVNNNNDPYYILTDHLNSSSILSDSTGTTAQLSDYKPFGSINYENEIFDLKNDYKHTGKELDEESNLAYFGARYMDNQIGKFVSIDPATLKLNDDKKFKEKYNRSVQFFLSDPQNLNTYAYALNNPIKHTDPDGEILPVVALAAAYVLFEVGMTAWDAYDTGNAWFGENSSNSDKVWAGGGLIAGIVLPGPGKAYRGIGENLTSRVAKDVHWNKGADVVLDHFKRHSQALTERTGKVLNNAMEYSKQAKEFVVKSGENFKYFFDNKENALVKWDTITHEFSALTQNGNIKTYFIRDNLNSSRFIETTVDKFNQIFK